VGSLGESANGTIRDAKVNKHPITVLLRGEDSSGRLALVVAGYLLLLRQGGPAPSDATQLDLLRRRFALSQLSLPRDEFPNLVESAEDTAEVWLSKPEAGGGIRLT
jgi:hypothetical protein